MNELYSDDNPSFMLDLAEQIANKMELYAEEQLRASNDLKELIGKWQASLQEHLKTDADLQ